MEKKKLRLPVGESKCFNAEILNQELTPIEDVQGYLDSCKNKGATHIHFHAISWGGESEEVQLEGMIVREETDEEFEERKALINKRLSEKEKSDLEKERKEYERLKAKF